MRSLFERIWKLLPGSALTEINRVLTDSVGVTRAAASLASPVALAALLVEQPILRDRVLEVVRSIAWQHPLIKAALLIYDSVYGES